MALRLLVGVWFLVSPSAPEQVSSAALPDDLGLARLGEEGFFEARVETLLQDTSVVVTVNPGRRYTLGQLVVEGLAPGASQAASHLESLRGQPYRAQGLRNAFDRIVAAHAEAGYPFAVVEVRHWEVDTTRATVSLRVGVTPGPRVMVEGVEPGRTSRTKASTLARLAGIRPGTWYAESALEQAAERLRRTEFFSQVGQPQLVAGSRPDRVVVRLPVVERPLHRVRGSVGFGSSGSLAGALEAQFRNIAGSGREGSFEWQRPGPGKTHLVLRYREPWILGLPPSLEVGISQVVEETLWVERQGSVGLRWDLGGGVHGVVEYRAKRVIRGEGSASLRTDEAGGEVVWHGEAARTARGWYALLRASYGSLRNLEEASSNPLVRVGLEYGRTLALAPRLVLRTRGVAHAAVLSRGRVPVPEMWGVGGARSVRGYRESQFRTDRAGVVNLALHWGTSPESSIFAFVDGAVLAHERRVRTLLGYGLGMVGSSSAGLVELSYGIPREAGPLGGRIHLSLGRAF